MLLEYVHGTTVAETLRVGNVASLEADQLYDQIFLGIRLTADLRQIGHVAAHLKPKGGIWIIYRKAQSDPSERHVIAAGRGAGLNDVKVCRFSETHTALRFVRRK